METILLLLVIFAVIGYVWYASIITRRNRVQEALSGIDVQLNKRHDLIPNILKIAARFMEHEKSLLEEITELRAQAQAGVGSREAGSVDSHLALETKLQGLMSRFFAVAENYPDLKSDATMVQAQNTYNEVEEHIAASRRFYNAAVTSLNNAVQVFPGNFFAGMAGVSAYPFFQADESVKAPVDADQYLKQAG